MHACINTNIYIYLVSNKAACQSRSTRRVHPQHHRGNIFTIERLPAFICKYACMYVHVYIYVYIHIHIYICVCMVALETLNASFSDSLDLLIVSSTTFCVDRTYVSMDMMCLRLADVRRLMVRKWESESNQQ